MKKGQKVRILRTNQVATIVEVELIRKGGKVHRYCHLKELHLAICQDYSKDKMTLHLTGKNPDNLKEASGLYARLMNLLIGSLKETREL